jgi:hypothetical protein
MTFDDAVDIGRSHFNALLQISEAPECSLEIKESYVIFSFPGGYFLKVRIDRDCRKV